VWRELEELLCPTGYDKSDTGREKRRKVARWRAGEMGVVKKAGAVRIEGACVKRLVKESEGEAPGVDDWRANFITDLPDEAYDAIADLWNAILKGGALPEIWTKVRVSTLPKEEGGYRGLSVASVLWRGGVTAIIENNERVGAGLASGGVVWGHKGEVSR